MADLAQYDVPRQHAERIAALGANRNGAGAPDRALPLRPPSATIRGMNFRPADDTRRLWDTWALEHQGLLHLFYLGQPAPGEDGTWRPWDGIGHAVSHNALDWKERPTTFLRSSDPAAWDAGVILTGNVFPLHDGFAMTYGAVQGSVQRTGLLVSPDLDTWTRVPGNPVLVAGPPYEGAVAETVSDSVEFRDVSVYPTDSGYEALFCARLNTGPHHGRGVVGRALSRDGKRWELTSPLFHPGALNCLEVPTRFSRDGRHYLLFTTNMHLEGYLASSRYPELRWLTYYAVSGRANAGFVWNPDNVLAPGDSTVGRIVHFGGESLFLHHTVCRRPALALPKAVEMRAEGAIILHPWKGTEVLEVSGASLEPPELVPLVRKGLATGDMLEGETRRLRAEGSVFSAFTRTEHRDFRLHVRLDWRGAGRVGVLLREEPATGRSIVLLLDRANGEAAIGRAWRKAFLQYGVELRHRLRLRAGELDSFSLEAVARSEGVDWYLDGALVFTTTHDDAPAAGRVGFFVDRGTVSVGGLRITELRAEPTPPGA